MTTRHYLLTLHFWLAGYRGHADSNCRSSCHWLGWSLNLNTRRGKLFLQLMELFFAIRRSPLDVRWWLADQLSRWASRLRRDKVSQFGIYNECQGNRAAALADELQMEYVFQNLDGGDDALEKFRAIREKLEELSSLASATRWRAKKLP